jgi:hypothetical protein
MVLSGNNSTAVSGTLTGAWSPDARTTDPSTVLDSSARNAYLSSFQNLPVNGKWTLFVTDLSSGGSQALTGWGMQITPVPEPSFYAELTAVTLLGFAFWRKLRARTSASN